MTRNDKMPMPTGLSEAVQFFWAHAGYSHTPGEKPETGRERCARSLARAETRMRDTGATVEWRDDEDGSLGAGDTSEGPWFGCILRDRAGNVLGSLWGIDFGPDDWPGNERGYSRVVAAELADEHIPEGC